MLSKYKLNAQACITCIIRKDLKVKVTIMNEGYNCLLIHNLKVSGGVTNIVFCFEKIFPFLLS